MLIQILIVFVLIVTLAAGYLRFLASRFLPLKAEKRTASREAGGEIQKINGFFLWTKIFYTKQDGIPYYVIPGGMGMKSQYLVEHLQFMAETNPLYFYDPRGCGRSESKEELAFYQWNQFSEELYEYIQKNTPDTKIGLVSHSCGCVILYDFLQKHKDIVDKVILLSAMPLRLEAGPPNIRYLLGKCPPKEPRLANRWFSEYVRGKVMFGSMFYGDGLEELDTSGMAMVLCTNINTNINKPYNYEGMFQKDEYEVLAVCGCREYEAVSTNEDSLKKIEKQFKNIKIKVFSKSGHFPFIEEKQTFKQVVSEFMKE